MPVGDFPARFADQLKCSNIFQRQLSQISWEAVVQLDGAKGPFYLCTEPIFDALLSAEESYALGVEPSHLCEDLLDMARKLEEPKVASPQARCDADVWHLSMHLILFLQGATVMAGLGSTYVSKVVLWIGLCFGLKNTCHQRCCQFLLHAIWPVLREDLVAEEAARDRPPTEQALLWTIATKTDSAVMVLDGNGCLLDCNDAGREYLDSGKLFQVNSSGRICCVQALETRSVSEAIRRCVATEEDAQPGRDADECLLFLREQDGEQALPVSFTRFQAAEGGDPMVVVILPRQPQRSRIELVAQKMGLSPTEARVAALLQLGLTNREAAIIAGVKEQTFNTYAKRVLSKMNVGSRSQVAQRLTWQAAWGRMV